MFEQVNAEIRRVSERVRAKRKLEAMLREAEQVLCEAHKQCNLHRRRLEQEKADVDKLNSLSLTALFYTVLGTKAEHIHKEQEELLAASLKFDTASRKRDQVQAEVHELRQELEEYTSADRDYAQLLEEKERILTEQGGGPARPLLEYATQLADLASQHQELQEATEAGQRVMDALRQVQSALQSAANWGTWDLLGGGIFVTMAKHSRIDAARSHARQAERHLRSFEKELADANERLGLSLNVGAFATFADYFFDGLIADWVMQSKVERASSACSSTMTKVSDVLGNCSTRMAEVEKAAEQTRNRQREYLERS